MEDKRERGERREIEEKVVISKNEKVEGRGQENDTKEKQKKKFCLGYIRSDGFK